MSGRPPYFGPNGDCRIAAGEILNVMVTIRSARDGADIDITGRTFAMTVYVAGTEAEIFSTSAVAAGTSALLSADGVATRGWRDAYQGVPIRLMIVEMVDGGFVVMSDGALTISAASRSLVPADTSITDVGPVVQTIFVEPSGKTLFIATGAPGFVGPKGDKGDQGAASTVPGPQGSPLRKGCMVAKSTNELNADYTSSLFPGISPGHPIPWDRECFDDANYYDPASPTRLTVPAGVSRVKVGFTVNTAVVDPNITVQVNIWKNSTPHFDGALQQRFGDGPIGPFCASASSGPILVSPGDYFEVFMFLTSDNSIYVLATTSMFWIDAC